MKFLVWVAIGVLVWPQVEKYVFLGMLNKGE